MKKSPVLYHHYRVSVAFLLIVFLNLTIVPTLKVNVVLADHGDTEITDGIYRIPYVDGWKRHNSGRIRMDQDYH